MMAECPGTGTMQWSLILINCDRAALDDFAEPYTTAHLMSHDILNTYDDQPSDVCILQVITVQAVINNVNKTFTLNNLSSVSADNKMVQWSNVSSLSQVRIRQDLGKTGVEDMIQLTDLNEASLLWNLRLRYDR